MSLFEWSAATGTETLSFHRSAGACLPQSLGQCRCLSGPLPPARKLSLFTVAREPVSRDLSTVTKKGAVDIDCIIHEMRIGVKFLGCDFVHLREVALTSWAQAAFHFRLMTS